MMKKINVKTTAKVMVGALAFWVLFCVSAPSLQADGVCAKALVKCMADAVVSLIISGPQTFAAYAGGCLNGYLWCLEYYVDFEK